MLGWLLASVALVATLAVGVVVHELLHATVLRTAGVRCAVEFRPRSPGGGRFETLVSGALASVSIESIPERCPAWRLRAAALAPLVMLLPATVFALLLTHGHVPRTLGTAVLVAWLGSALPSPADFAVVWHPNQTRSLLSRDGATAADGGADRVGSSGPR
jgi:hypothetical protein